MAASTRLRRLRTKEPNAKVAGALDGNGLLARVAQHLRLQ